MLTVEHVKLRRKAGVVGVAPLCGVPRAQAVAQASLAVDITRAHEGEPRALLEEALDALALGVTSASEARFARGLKKLALDACDFGVDSGLDPSAVRASLFTAAAAARRASSFDRARVMSDTAATLGVTAEELERALYADLGAAHAVKGFDIEDGEAMLARYGLAELQAVLLRATSLTIDVDGAPVQLRRLLRALKLHQLLFEVQSHQEHQGVRIVVEGPMALFQQSTRYGLKLALLLPAVLACPRYRLEAPVRIRKHGALEPFVLEGKRAIGDGDDAPLPELTSALLEELSALAGPWRATVALDVLMLPGAGALVPDLQLENQDTGEVVFVEILGFWSRAAVWKRVEMVEKGLPYRVIFCASERLRVSEEALPTDASGALVVFKGALRASRVMQAINRLSR